MKKNRKNHIKNEQKNIRVCLTAFHKRVIEITKERFYNIERVIDYIILLIDFIFYF